MLSENGIFHCNRKWIMVLPHQHCLFHQLMEFSVSNSESIFKTINSSLKLVLNVEYSKKYLQIPLSCVLTSFNITQFKSLLFDGPFYHKGFSDYCLRLYCYFHNVSADVSSGLFQVFVKLRNLHGTSRGCRFNPDYRRVTIQEYLTLVPGYG